MSIKQHGLHGLLHAANLVEGIAREQLVAVDVLPRQAQVLSAISRMGQASQIELAQTFGVSSASMSTMTERLLAVGLISRDTDPLVRKRNVLVLTAKGGEKLNGIHTAWDAVDARIEQALGSDAATFFTLSRRLRDALGGKVPGMPDEDAGCRPTDLSSGKSST